LSALSKAARGKPCQVRLPCCNGNAETTVSAHYRLAGLCGVGMKPPDVIAADTCSACHDECDRRTRRFETEFVRHAHAEGVLRTIVARMDEGFEFTKRRS
jgi:hypothetical protein